MATEDVIGFVILSFLAGSLATMVLFTILQDRLDKKYSRER